MMRSAQSRQISDVWPTVGCARIIAFQRTSNYHRTTFLRVCGTESCLISKPPFELVLKFVHAPEFWVFVVKTIGNQRWNRKSPYCDTIRTKMMCGHQAHDLHTPGTRQKRWFSDFAKFRLKIHSIVHVPIMCLMSANTFLILPFWNTS